MRTTSTALLVATLVVGCKGKQQDSQPADKVMGSATGAAKPADDMKPEPVAKQPAKEPAAAPATPEPATAAAPADDGKVRPPVAADLEVYTKDIAGKGPLTAAIETSLGTFHCVLYGDKSPITVANFVGLATGKKPWENPKTGAVENGKPYFDGLTFHRVIPGFMIQGGDPLGVGSGGPGYQFVNEADPSLTWKPATLAMANAGANTNGSQFFITDDMQDGQKSALGHNYSIFGVCKELDLVRKIEGVPRSRRDKPNEPVTITKVTIARS